MNTFFKQIYRYSRPRSYRHNENFWPYFKIIRSTTGCITKLKYKNQLIPLISLNEWQDKFNGDILLIATGPSVRKINFKKIPKMMAMGVNGAYALKNKLDFQLYTIVDMNFIDNHTNMMQSIIADSKLTLFTTLYGISKIINLFKITSIQCKLTLIENIYFRIYQPRIFIEDIKYHFNKNTNIKFSANNTDIAFNTDIRNGIFDSGTVIFWTLQILLFLGFKNLYIIGLDMNNFNKPRFYENENNKLPSFLENKFHSIIVPSFTLASKIFKENGIKVKNLSINSALSNEIFEKINFYEIFKN